MQADETLIRDTYGRYLQRCNRHTVQDLAEFIAPDVNGPDRGWKTYAADLQEVIDALPDIHWDLQQLIVDGNWLAARLVTTGTHQGTFRDLAPTGRRVSIQELVVYRWDGERFVECWGDLAAVLRDALMPASPRTSE